MLLPKLKHTEIILPFKPMKVGGSAEVGITVDWGASNGTKVSGYAKGSARDDRGNKAEASAEVKGDGSGSVTVSVSHTED